MIDNPKSVYYKKKQNNLLKEHLEIQDVEDVGHYWKLADEALFNVGKILGNILNLSFYVQIGVNFINLNYIGVCSRIFKHESRVRQMFSLAGWVPFYFLFNKKKGADQGLFFMNSFNKHTFRRMNSMYEIGTLKSLIKISLPKVEVESKIYIKIPANDQLDKDNNLKSKKIPEMVSENLDIPFEVNIKNYDPSEYLKMRVITCEDWGAINWKTGEIENETDEVRHCEVALLYVHGGAFVSGSSGTYQTVLRKYATSTGYPVFAVDYRLAPDHKFPIPLSDSWLAYLWLRYYSEKYLRIKFGKIILVGDSAGS